MPLEHEYSQWYSKAGMIGESGITETYHEPEAKQRKFVQFSFESPSDMHAYAFYAQPTTMHARSHLGSSSGDSSPRPPVALTAATNQALDSSAMASSSSAGQGFIPGIEAFLNPAGQARTELGMTAQQFSWTAYVDTPEKNELYYVGDHVYRHKPPGSGTKNMK